jgi:hypothetical protein
VNGAALRLGVAAQHNFPSGGGWQMHIDHLHGGELRQRATGGEARRQTVQAAVEVEGGQSNYPIVTVALASLRAHVAALGQSPWPED